MANNLLKPLVKATLLVAVFVAVFAGAIIAANPATAQVSDSLGIAQPYPITTDDPASIQEGMIISHRFSQYQLSSEPYEKNMFGVVNLVPAVSFESDTPLTENLFHVSTAGTTEVMVSAINGPIQAGNRLTSSEIPGIAMKADKSGFTLGVAQQSFSPNDPNATTVIPVSLDIQFTFAEDSPNSERISRRLIDVVSLSAISAIESPNQALRHVVAAIVLVGSIIAAIITFARSAQNGIQALGRNPLAQSSITLGIIINITISVMIVAAGIAGSYFILTI